MDQIEITIPTPVLADLPPKPKKATKKKVEEQKVIPIVEEVVQDAVELEYIYILREREFIRLRESIYKVGRTKQKPEDRFSGYPKGSEILLYINVDDSVGAEKLILTQFKKEFKQKKEYGTEYFEGSLQEMMKIVMNVGLKTPGIQELKQEVEDLRLKLDISTKQHELFLSKLMTVIREDVVKEEVPQVGKKKAQK